VEHLPFDDNAFDKALAVNSMQVWPDSAAGLREMRRVIKPGGGVALGFTPYSGQQNQGLKQTLSAAGFAKATVVEKDRWFCALALKPQDSTLDIWFLQHGESQPGASVLREGRTGQQPQGRVSKVQFLRGTIAILRKATVQRISFAARAFLDLSHSTPRLRLVYCEDRFKRIVMP
jgi:SAM-dependent methyltransferase